MTKSSEDHCHGLRCMDAGDLAPLVTEFTRHLTVLGHKSLTVSGYDAAAGYLAQWLTLAKIAVAGIDDGVADRFALASLSMSRHPSREERVREVREAGAPVHRVSRRARNRPAQAEARITDAPPPGGRVPGLTATASRRHRADNRSARSHGHAAAPGAWHQAAKLECSAHSRRDHCRDEAGLAGLCEDDDDGAERIFAVPQRAGVCRAGLDQAVPIIPQWRLSSLPRYIRSSDVETLIATCDQTRATGVRDRAILLLLARLGLRASDILSLRLTDIDWQQATLSVRGKGRRETRLPLPQDAGDAVLAYLDQARPHVVGGRIFFMLNAPIRPLTRSSVVSDVCAVQYERPASPLRRMGPTCFDTRPRRPCSGAARRSTRLVPCSATARLT
ncbi:integrase/recombinase XerD [Bradyrhizobium sp. USDA 223]